MTSAFGDPEKFGFVPDRGFTSLGNKRRTPPTQMPESTQRAQNVLSTAEFSLSERRVVGVGAITAALVDERDATVDDKPVVQQWRDAGVIPELE